jgi:hypothetical protein
MLPLDILQSRLLANDVLAKSFDVLVVVDFSKVFRNERPREFLRGQRRRTVAGTTARGCGAVGNIAVLQIPKSSFVAAGL